MSGSKGKKKELMVQMLTATVGSLMFAIGVNLMKEGKWVLYNISLSPFYNY